MTLNTTQTPESSEKLSFQQHHQKASEHLLHASTSHSAAAKAFGAFDTKSSQEHAKTASDHTAHARQHVSHAEKIAVSSSSHSAASPT